MRGSCFESMADLNAIAERIVAVNGMAALLVPRNLCRIRSPIEFSPVELFENRRIQLRRNPKIDMRAFDGSRAPLGDLVDFAQNHELSGIGHGQSNLILARNLCVFAQSERI